MGDRRRRRRRGSAWSRRYRSQCVCPQGQSHESGPQLQIVRIPGMPRSLPATYSDARGVVPDAPRSVGEPVTERLALFPLGTVLFPGLVLPLHLFEERYRLLIGDLLERPEPRRFGVVGIELGHETGDE